MVEVPGLLTGLLLVLDPLQLYGGSSSVYVGSYENYDDAVDALGEAIQKDALRVTGTWHTALRCGVTVWQRNQVLGCPLSGIALLHEGFLGRAFAHLALARLHFSQCSPKPCEPCFNFIRIHSHPEFAPFRWLICLAMQGWTRE